MITLNDTQMNVFKAVVYLDKSTIGRIAQHTGMHRHSVKIVLQTLIGKGFVNMEQQANKLLYSTENPEKIKELYLSQLEETKKNIPQLTADYEETKDTQIINAVSGKLGLRTVLMDEIMKGKEICAFNLSKIREDYLEEYKANDKRRVESNIPLRVLTAFPLENLPLSKIKYIDRKSMIDLFVYANKITIFYDNFETKIFTIKIDEVTKFFRDIFNNNWKKSKR